MNINKPKNWPIPIGSIIIINKVGSYKNVQGIPIKKFNDDSYIVQITDQKYQDLALANTEYKTGYYLLKKDDDWLDAVEYLNKLAEKEEPKEGIKKEEPKKELPKKEEPKKELSKEEPKKELPKKELPKELPKEEPKEGIKKESKKEEPKKELPKKELSKEEPKKELPKEEPKKESSKEIISNYPPMISTDGKPNKNLGAHYPGFDSRKVTIIPVKRNDSNEKTEINLISQGESPKKSISENKEFKNMLKTLPKIDTYNPKYLEALELNVNKYALTFKNLDLYDDTQIDSEFKKMSIKRLADLERQSGSIIIADPIMRKVIESATVINPINEKSANVAYEYLSPIHKEEDKIRLLRKLEPRLGKQTPLYRAKHEIVVNNLHITEDNLITKEEYEIAEGAKIISWIENNLVYYGGSNSSYYNQMIFADLMTLQYKGHIYLSKAGVQQPSIVRSSDIELKYLTNFYGKHINDTELVEYIKKNSENKSLTNEITEANKLLALEYYICLQPQTRYMLYILKRLVVAWYTDFDLITNITKIRILINQFRANRNQKDNLKFGVLPMIQIQLRYGITTFSTVISKLNYYFTNFIHTGWIGSGPDYYTKYNDLIYYSNGSPDIKRFFEHVPAIKQSDIYKEGEINPSAFLKFGEDVISSYPQPYPNINKLKYQSKFDIIRELNKTGKVKTEKE
jgi:hypothetical protein